MLKKYIALYAPDVNDASGSSNEADVKVEESSSSEQVEKHAEEVKEETSEETPEDGAETETTSEEQTDDSQDSQQDDANEKKTEEAIPYERFTEVNNKKTELERELETAKPLVEQAKATQEFLRQYNITPQEHQGDLQFRALLRTDPAKAFQMMKPLYEQLAQYVGEVLPQDLQGAVAAGTLDPTIAKELASARAKQVHSQWQQQNVQQGQQVQSGEVLNQTINSWVQLKQQLDPDLKEGTPLWKQTDLILRSLPQPRTPLEQQQNCEKAYTEAKAFLNQFQRTQAVKKPLASRQTHSNNGQVMKTADDVVRAIAGGLKPNQMKYA